MEIVFFLILFIAFIGNLLFFAKQCRFPVAASPLLIFLLYTILLYIFALFNGLQLGLWILYAIAILLSGLGFYALIKNWPERKEVLSTPFYISILLFIAVWLYTRYSVFWKWDEFSHWGVMWKTLMTTNQVPQEFGTVVFPYPPFTALYQYLIAKALGFQEANAYFAQMLVFIYAILAMMPNKKKWTIYNGLIFFTAGISIHFFDYYIQSMYVDGLMGALFACALVHILWEDEDNLSSFLCILLTSVALVLTKPTGVLFFGGITLLFLLKKALPLLHRMKRMSDYSRKSIAFSAILIIVPLLTLFSWNSYSDGMTSQPKEFTLHGQTQEFTDIFPQFGGEYEIDLKQQQIEQNTSNLTGKVDPQHIAVEDVLKSFTVAAPARSKQILNAMVAKFGDPQLSGIPKVSYYHLLIVLLLLIAFESVLLSFSQQTQRKKTLIPIHICLFVGFIAYFVFLYLTYVFHFDAHEAIDAPSFLRYLGTYLLGWWLLIITILLYLLGLSNHENGIQKTKLSIITLCTVLILVIKPGAYLHLPMDFRPERIRVNHTYKFVQDGIFTEEDKVFHIWVEDEQSEGFEHFMMRYYLTPIPSNRYGWMLGEVDKKVNEFMVALSPEEWLDLLNTQEYTYVMISYADGLFWETYGSLFDQYERISEGVPQLFKVTNSQLISVSLP